MNYNVYLVCAKIGDEKLYKIGYTRRKVEKRIKELKTGNAADFYIVDSFNSKWGTKIEALLHRAYQNKKINGEWFELTKEEVNKFKSKCESSHRNFEIISKTTYYQENGKFY